MQNLRIVPGTQELLKMLSYYLSLDYRHSISKSYWFLDGTDVRQYNLRVGFQRIGGERFVEAVKKGNTVSNVHYFSGNIKMRVCGFIIEEMQCINI